MCSAPFTMISVIVGSSTSSCKISSRLNESNSSFLKQNRSFNGRYAPSAASRIAMSIRSRSSSSSTCIRLSICSIRRCLKTIFCSCILPPASCFSHNRLLFRMTGNIPLHLSLSKDFAPSNLTHNEHYPPTLLPRSSCRT